jgi:uncharacterized metal-binding protein YceD (DUF177 family)
VTVSGGRNKISDARPWSVPVALDDVPETGRQFDLAADERTRTALAEALRLRALPRLSAAFTVNRRGREGLHVTGEVSATVGQTCVVSLEPLESEVAETVDLVFEPPRAGLDPSGSAEGEKEAGEGPEPLHGGVVDLGAVATEFLILGIDPYPRKPGAVLDAPPAGPDEAADHPFAALAALKPRKDGTGA